MPAVPRKKSTRHRIGSRRAGGALTAPHLTPCPRCHSPRPSHRACPVCGTYKGRPVLGVSEEAGETS